jgi:hypothetical protein
MNMAAVAVEAQNLPMANVLLLNALMNQDGEGTANIQKWARKQLVQMGVEEPTDDEKAEMEQAAQQQQMDPERQLAMAKVAEIGAKAEQFHAKAGEAQASSVLKIAQAKAVGGPVEQPDTPDGLDDADKLANIHKTLAEARQIDTATSHMPQKLAIESHNAMTNRIKVHEQSRMAKFKSLLGGKK